MPFYLGAVATLLLSFLLIKATDEIIVALKRISKKTGIQSFTVAAIFLALATSFPELSVGITSALSGVSSLSLGNIAGANIANISLILGLSGILAGTIKIKDFGLIDKDIPLTLFAGLAPFLLLWDRTLSRFDGLLLILLYGAYASGFFHHRFLEVGRAHQEGGAWQKIIREIKTGEGDVRTEFIRFFIALIVLLFSANFLIEVSTNFARDIGVPLILIGMLLVSVGTTFPEFLFSLRAIQRGAPSVLLGNLLGSVVVNSTLVLGLVALISPIVIPHRREYLLAASTFLLATLLFWLFSRTKHALYRLEAGILFFIYCLFVVLQLSGFDPLTSLIQ